MAAEFNLLLFTNKVEQNTSGTTDFIVVLLQKNRKVGQ
jgi:hypothetical protein